MSQIGNQGSTNIIDWIKSDSVIDLPNGSTAYTQVTSDSSSKIATTAFVKSIISSDYKVPNASQADNATYAVSAGTAARALEADTQDAGTNNTKIATTEFVKTAIGNIDLTPYAPKASPALTGTPTAPTADSTTNSTQIATTEFVKNVLPTKISSFINDSGYITSAPSKTSQLTNDSGYITSSSIPAVPSKTSQLTNDSGFSGGGINSQLFTSSGTFTVPTGVTSLKVTVVGGGGGAYNAYGGSTAGGTSSFGSFCSATGGSTYTFGGVGGVGVGGTFNYEGSSGAFYGGLAGGTSTNGFLGGKGWFPRTFQGVIPATGYGNGAYEMNGLENGGGGGGVAVLYISSNLPETVAVTVGAAGLTGGYIFSGSTPGCVLIEW